VIANSLDDSSISDASSVYARGVATRRLNDTTTLMQKRSHTSSSSRPDSRHHPSVDVHFAYNKEEMNDHVGVTPMKSNMSNRRSDSADGALVKEDDDGLANSSSETISPITAYRGRYESSNQRGGNREAVLKQIQRKVRAPSPPQSNDTSRRSNIDVEQKYESQTSLLLKSIPAAKMKELSESLSPGQYLMVLRPGMLGVNLKQTFLPGYGVYIDQILPGGNAEKSGVICIGDCLMKVGDVDVSKGTIYDVPGIIAKAKRPAILIFNGEHETKVEDMDYLTVAFGLVNRIVSEAPLGMTRSLTEDIPVEPESYPFIVPETPPKELRVLLHDYSKRR
jgi:hypothetical protein